MARLQEALTMKRLLKSIGTNFMNGTVLLLPIELTAYVLILVARMIHNGLDFFVTFFPADYKNPFSA